MTKLETSPVFPGIKIGDRVKQSFRDWRGKILSGKIIKFKDVLDMDALDDGYSEEEATVKGGAFVVLLDEGCRPRMKEDDGSVRVVENWTVDYETAEDWETV
jgi:hypothetical protein